MTVLTLRIVTPLRIALSVEGVTSIRCEDETGGFGILPGHADFLTVLDAGVLRWQLDGQWHFAALRGGVVTVERGSQVVIACREVVFGDDLETLEAKVVQARAAQADAARHARMTDTRLHARAIRQMMRALNGTPEIAEVLSESSP